MTVTELTKEIRKLSYVDLIIVAESLGTEVFIRDNADLLEEVGKLVINTRTYLEHMND